MMDRETWMTGGIPRASGGVSITGDFGYQRGEYSPRKRGCFRQIAYMRPYVNVFPAQAGVFLSDTVISVCSLGIPRASGGVSDRPKVGIINYEYSPRKRGCFPPPLNRVGRKAVFPAQAGVFPNLRHRPAHLRCIPRASGGVSGDLPHDKQTPRYSPRKRGCFHGRADSSPEGSVFPAQAGVFLLHRLIDTIFPSIPRASGGVTFFDG